MRKIIFCRQTDIFIPTWIRSTIELPIAIKSRSLKEDLRIIRKQNFTYELTVIEDDIKHFYERMWKPTIEARHGVESISFIQLEDVIHQVKKGDQALLKIFKNGEVIAGGLLKYRL